MKKNTDVSVVVRHYSVRDRHFVIVKHETGYYCAIEDKYIKDGRLTRELNGLQMNASKKIEDCLERTKSKVDLDYYIKSGMTKAQAFCKVTGCEYTEELEGMF